VTDAALTVVIPTRDRPRDLRRAARCALAQEGVRIEIVVVDDASTIPAADVLQDLDVPAPHDLRVVRQDAPLGVARARNRGLEVARTGWVGFCDDDDMWAPTKAAEQIRAAGTDAGWTCSSAMKVDEHLRPLEVVPAPDPATASSRLLAANVVPGGASSVIAHTEIARAVGGFDPELSALADWDFWVRLAQETPLAIVARPLVAYLVRAQSMSTDTRLLDEDVQRFRQKHATARAARNVDFDDGNWCSYVAEMHLREGQRLRAAREYLRAVRNGNRHAWRLAAASLVAPAWANTRLRYGRRTRTDPAWVADAEAWLRPLTEAPLEDRR
jgi:glycosyltransferase involved in cell wall biosynthesis